MVWLISVSCRHGSCVILQFHVLRNTMPPCGLIAPSPRKNKTQPLRRCNSSSTTMPLKKCSSVTSQDPYGFLAHTFQVAVCMHGITTTTSTQPQTQHAGPLHVTKLGWHPSQVDGIGAITPILRRERPDRVVCFEQPRDIREHREHCDEEMISRRRSSESSVVSFFPFAPCRRHPYAGFVDQL